MNDNDILLATQNGCDLVLTTEEGGDYPVGSKVLYYKDADGNDQSVDLTSLTDGTELFKSNSNLNIDWDANLPNLTNGTGMFFQCSNLTSFSGSLPMLVNGTGMFSACYHLTSFSADLPNLTNGTNMFGGCPHLTSWIVDLPKLTNGTGMFMSCKFDKASVHRIAESIPTKPDDATSGYELALGIDAFLENDPDVAADLALIGTTKKWDLTIKWG